MKKIVVTLGFLALSLFAKGDLYIFDANNANGQITSKKIEKSFQDNGFSIGVGNEMTGPFKKQFQQSDYKIFTLLTVYEPKLSAELVKKHPHAGVFVPMSIGIYQANGEKVIHVSALTSDALAKIIGIKNNDLLKAIEKKTLKSIKDAMPNAKEHISEDSFKESRNLVTVYEYDLDGEDWEDAKDEIEMALEGGFAPKGFIMPASLDYEMGVFQEDDENNPFDFYKSYSICKLPVIYTVAKSRPEAAAFAPCTTMLYKKKDEDKIVMGFPAVYNWMSSARVEDKDAHDVLMKAQHDFESILKSITE